MYVQLDAGGPLVCRKSANSNFTLVGVYSWVFPPCGIDGKDGLPSVYMFTGYKTIRDFISQFVNI